MKFDLMRRCRRRMQSAVILLGLTGALAAANPGAIPTAPAGSDTTVARLISAIRARAKVMEGTSGMRGGYQAFVSKHNVTPESVSYSDYVIVRLLFEATRDAGFWNLHWTITDRQPVSDDVWRQWKNARMSSLATPTASAECDELSALYAFLVGRAGVRGVGLFWPTANHTVAVWVISPPNRPAVRVVVPTSQIFLDQSDFFGTTKFDPWRQKTIHEYVRRDVPDSFELPKPLFNFFLIQVDKYAGASDATLQHIRYLREGVFRGDWSAEGAARDALKMKSDLGSGPHEDLVALQNFALDMRTGLLR